MRECALIPAAGMSRRMKDFKPLLTINGQALAETTINTLRRGGIREIWVVTGFRGQQLEEALEGPDVHFVRNPNYEHTQMFDSIVLGLKQLRGEYDRVYFCPADIAFFRPDTVSRLRERAEPLVIPTYREKCGHPICFDAALIPDILTDPGEKGLKGAFQKLRIRPFLVPVEDRGITLDADTPEDFLLLRSLFERQDHGNSCLEP